MTEQDTSSQLSRLGVNYWPAHAGPYMWREFDEEAIAADLRALRAAGVEYTRSFLFWPDFMPEPDRVEPAMMERLGRFMDLHEEARLGVHLTLLVGHMSGQNWPPPWMPDPSRLYTDPGLLLAQERYLTTVVEAVRPSPALEAYVLTNELPLFTGPAPVEAVQAWSSRMVGLLKRLDPDRSVSLGDGAWYVLGDTASGFRPTHAQDVIAPHLYLADTHPGRQLAAYGLAMAVARRLARDAGKAIWLEEFGATHSVFGEEEVARWARGVVTEARLHGAEQVCWWCGFDFPEAMGERPPYSHHPHELSFGMMRSDRSPRPVAAALREATVAPLPNLRRAGLLIPSWVYRAYPFGEPWGAATRRAFLNAYAALRELGYLPEVVLEDDLGSQPATAGNAGPVVDAGLAAAGPYGLPPILAVPSVQKLQAATWARLEAYPGRVLYSYLHATAVRSHEGAWISAASARRFFGGEARNRFNLPEPAPRGLVWEGGRIDLPKGPDPFSETPLLVRPKEAAVLGRDDQGRPLWIRAGRRDLLLFPIEALADDLTPVIAFYRAVLRSPPEAGS
ncbi:glycoside hydrolase 5 family protein [Limnochorda pilosa]|uniref:Glycoside hydrolase family 5 domain-containing protein n=1 Tax=Limnochorda pilosa TaxID=1555112 RepID=A0A0K2SIF7_LIMPI|nr:hypothetical protein [Limnochorda pilosa]BAS26802.1 hypothetical protein LIP_0945 [Limnochorda pilosa]